MALTAAGTTTSTSSSTATTAKKKPTHHSSTHASSTKTASHSTSKNSSKKSKKTATKHGQQKIDADRTHQIQTALIREHYMDGEATGKWDDATEKAMQKYQADNGWQSKTVPDSRALIKMGLGPNQDHLLNPESAMTATPAQRPNAVVDPAKFPTSENQPQR
jgi:uncharacterized low-complexity protein